MKESNKELFENKQLWEHYDKSGQIREKAEYLLQSIPDSIESIIDVGCGNGIITNEFAKQYQVVGVDTSKEALKYLQCEKIISSSSAIPVDDLSYDMVFSSELLEHLQKDILIKTISEFKRISKRYIFITVPNREFLKKRYIKCPKCNYIFHVDHHLNSFSEEKIIELIGNEFQLLKTDYFGWLDKKYNRILLKIKNSIGDIWYVDTREYIVCPDCKNSDFPKKKGNLVSKLCNGLNRLISSKKPYWMYMIFKREDTS